MLGRFIMEDQIRGKGSNPLVNIIRGGSNMLGTIIYSKKSVVKMFRFPVDLEHKRLGESYETKKKAA